MKVSHKSICTFLLILGMICFKNIVIAQTVPLYNVKGILTDSLTQKSAGYATVSLKNAAMQVVRTAVTREDGSFNFEKLPAADYTLNLVNIGYVAKSLPLKLNNATNPIIDLGKILISPQSNQLALVSVTADRPVVKQEIDRLVYDLQADPESKGNNVLEMMRKVPLLSVDGEDNVLLKGSNSYKILINGKPSSMMERNAKDILRSMPASSIKNIEVIFNPSSKYDAEGVAGIINIITNKNTLNGYNGSINVNERFPVGGPGAGGSFTFKQGELGMSVLGGASTYSSPLASSSNNRNTDITDLNQENIHKSDSKNGYIGSEVSYEIDSLNLISGQFNINRNRSDGSSSFNSLLNGTSGVLESYDLDNTNNGNGSGLDAGLNYQLGFRSNKSKLLTFSYHLLEYENEQFSGLEISNRMNYTRPDYNQANKGNYTEQTFQIDYVHPLKKLNIEAGLKSILRTNKSDFEYRTFNTASGEFDLDPAGTNKYNSKQDVYAAYNSYTYNLKNWGFRAGVRIEQTVINADFISGLSVVKQNYFNVIPAISLNRKFKDMSSMVLSFSTRLQRPVINQLNPFVDQTNPSFESAGNPNIKPAFTNVAQVSYNRSKKTSISITAAYMFFNSMIGPISTYNSVTGITRTTFGNAGKGKIFRSNFAVNYPVTKKLNLAFNTDIRYGWITTKVNDIPVKNEAVMGNVNFSGGYRFQNGIRVNGNLSMNTSTISSPQGKSNGYTSTSFSMNKDLVKDKLSFSASVNNPFNKYRINREESIGPDFTQISNSQNYYRAFSTSLNYRFGKLKEGIKKNRRNIVNDDTEK